MKNKKKEKEQRELEKQKLREERKKYNERFANLSKINRNRIYPKEKQKVNSQMGFYQRLTYNSNKLYQRKRRLSHIRIQPRNRIPRLEPKNPLGKTTVKIIKPKRYDGNEEGETEPIDFEEKLMKFPKFGAKYGKNYVLKNKN